MRESQDGGSASARIAERILAARGVESLDAQAFLRGPGKLHDPFGLHGMREAVATIAKAVREKQRIGIYGDYDADGVTSSAMLTRAFRAAGIDVIPYIPNRVTEGYGLNSAALKDLASRGVQCVITVDCGTSSVDVVANRPQGMSIVVTDHHLPLAPDGTPPRLAPADALINPKQPDCTYEFDGLAGAGVAWKLLCALESEAIIPRGESDAAVGLAALGTIADMMPLRGENRSIVQLGLQRIPDLCGLRTLCAVADISSPLKASDVGFGIGPRINAAGRMEDAKLALDLCLTDDPAEAEKLALQLNQQNLERQQAVASALAQAEEQMAEYPDDAHAIVLGDPGWPMGIVGLVAGRIMERYALPTFAVCLDAKEAKGSARSVEGVHIVKALDHAAPALLRYGGHMAAAGFSLDASRFAEFRELIELGCAAQMNGRIRQRVFHIDTHVSGAEINPALCEELQALEPCGIGNPQPLLALNDSEVLSVSTFGSEKQHIRLALGDGTGVVEAIAFHKPNLANHLPRGRKVDVCFAIELDSWQGQLRVRARLRDIRPAKEMGTNGSHSAPLLTTA